MSPREMPFGSHALSVDPHHENDGPASGRSAGDSVVCGPPVEALRREDDPPQTFDAVYQTYAGFVWRNARRLGVPASAAEDVMQEVFLVVHRRLPEFEEQTSMRAWLSAILIRVVRAYWRTRQRKNPGAAGSGPPLEPDGVVDAKTPSPLEAAERDEAVRELYEVLLGMNEERREVLVLSEIEQLTAPEIAQALGVNLNTVYWRLRTARKEFERDVFRRRAAERWPAR
jgi:RNA polymerase sigma-70 factor, ECF subfamily